METSVKYQIEYDCLCCCFRGTIFLSDIYTLETVIYDGMASGKVEIHLCHSCCAYNVSSNVKQMLRLSSKTNYREVGWVGV